MLDGNKREYKTLITAIGKAKIAAAVHGSGKVNITQAAVGDGNGNYYIPTADMTTLVNEVWRGDIAGKWINEQSSNMADVKVILPADVGGFTVREAALFDEYGDMIAICNIPDTEKAVITTGAAGTLTIIMHIVLTDVDVVEFTVDPHLDVVTAADVEAAIQRHNADQNAHEAKFHVITTRTRSPEKPGYGLGGGGEAEVLLEVSPYTGDAEVSVIVNGTAYNADNMSTSEKTAESGTLIINKMEE